MCKLTSEIPPGTAVAPLIANTKCFFRRGLLSRMTFAVSNCRALRKRGIWVAERPRPQARRRPSRVAAFACCHGRHRCLEPLCGAVKIVLRHLLRQAALKLSRIPTNGPIQIA